MKQLLTVIAVIVITLSSCEKQASSKSKLAPKTETATKKAKGNAEAVQLADVLLTSSVSGNTVTLTWTLPADPKWTFIQYGVNNLATNADFTGSQSIYQPDWIASTGSPVTTKDVTQASGTTLTYRVSGSDAADNTYVSNKVTVTIP